MVDRKYDRHEGRYKTEEKKVVGYGVNLFPLHRMSPARYAGLRDSFYEPDVVMNFLFLPNEIHDPHELYWKE